ncbi:MAG: DUF819 family protein [Calditrichaeota bacterium]|nr:MAG: DUF819 family protein [Calditrichota bacterium]MBL1205761.1 DUF819 family protein [Calditrichota bacterium]NOG45589.1 DUF819 family protein [Calditrichota bacterium]
MEPLITNDAVVLGILLTILAVVFKTSSIDTPFWKKFYTFIPTVLLCYFIPSIFNSLGIISGEHSQLYFMASRYLLPSSLVLLTLSVDINAIIKLGWRAIVMFLTGTIGIVIGGPIAILIISFFAPDVVGGAGPEAVWRGLTTIAGSWIGGGANQTAMREVFEVSDKLFSQMLPVDIIIGYLWMGVLLYGAGINKKIDNWLKADVTAIDDLRVRVEKYRASIAHIPTVKEITIILAFAFGTTGIAHFLADIIAPWLASNLPFLKDFGLTSTFFWIVVIATTGGLILSFTKARKLEGAGASNIGTIFLYILIAAIGMSMDLTAIVENPGLFLVGIVWIMIHVVLLFIVGKLIKAPFFFIAVGSQANVGGTASAPIVASAFHTALAPVGVLLAVLGYVVGTYGAILTGWLMQIVAP